MEFRVLLFVSFLVSVDAIHEKSIINYLGTNFVVSDGCPLPKCEQNTEDCLKTHNTIRSLYSHCLQSEDGQHVGCVTDRMGDGSYLTVPTYATVCSAMCYESPIGLRRVKKCPHEGHREHSLELNEIFN